MGMVGDQVKTEKGGEKNPMTKYTNTSKDHGGAIITTTIEGTGIGHKNMP